MELTLRSSELSDDRLQRVTEELAAVLQNEAGISAQPPEGEAQVGSRGDPITIGVLLVTALSSGAVGALFNSLTAFFQRSKTLEIDIKRADGTSLTLKSENVSEEDRDRTLEHLREFVED